MSRRTALAVFARGPSAAGKTRLAPHLPHARLHALRIALLADTLRAVAALDAADRFIFFTPDAAKAEIAAHAGADFTLLPQRGDDLGQRMRAALEVLLTDGGYESAILVGSDIPGLTPAHLAEADEILRTKGGVVLGPADDGGYYLIGMRHAEAGLFDGIEWGTASVLSETVRTANRLGLETRLLPHAYDIDTIEDLQRLERDLVAAPPDVALNIRAWFNDR